MKRLFMSVLMTALLGGVGAVYAAGTVEVQYVQPDRFTDIGRWHPDEDRNLASLSAVFKALGKQLPDGQTLQLQVLDVDLAGDVDPVGVHQVRIVRGGADWPRMTLRYTLKQGEQTLKSGESHLSDLGYTFGQTAIRDDSNLPYEKRMVDAWFKRTVLASTTASR